MTAAMRVVLHGRTPWALGRTAATNPSIARGVAKRRGVRRGPYRRHLEALAMADPSFDGSSLVAADQLDAYAYMLGMYLGDGYLSGIPGFCRLEVALDAKYPALIERCAEAMRILRPDVKVARSREKDGCVVLTSYGWRWLGLFPHHGRGRKHLRKIELREWQRGIVRRRPYEFIRGLIESDGCRSVRRQDGKDYPFYSFNNRSQDIIEMFCWACDLVGLHYTRPRPDCVSIARRRDVADMDRMVGRKD